MRIEWSEQSRSDLRGILLYVGMNFGWRRAEEALADIRERGDAEELPQPRTGVCERP